VKEILVPVGEDPKGRAKAMLAICETMKHMETLRLLARREWISVDELSKRSGFSRRVVYRVVKDLVASGLVEMRVESGRRVYRVADGACWIISVLEEPEVSIRVGEGDEGAAPSHFVERLSADELALELVQHLCRSGGPISLTQLSARARAWRIDVKERLNDLIREGIVRKRGREYVVSPEAAGMFAGSNGIGRFTPKAELSA
jgi:predicted transcriptional regulator